MLEFCVVSNLDECQVVWKQVVPQEGLTDIWEVRVCFHEYFQRRPHFIVARDGNDDVGLFPLSWIDEAEAYGYFPGETWAGKTWLEQNRILARDEEVLRGLLENCPYPYHLRYLLPHKDVSLRERRVDEIGYLFSPAEYDYDIENYFQRFSSKSSKRFKREIASFEARGVRYRYDDPSDFDHIVRLNIGRFGADSYFHDPRFRESFRSLAKLLDKLGWLRLTTVLIGDERDPLQGRFHRGAADACDLEIGGSQRCFVRFRKCVHASVILLPEESCNEVRTAGMIAAKSNLRGGGMQVGAGAVAAPHDSAVLPCTA